MDLESKLNQLNKINSIRKSSVYATKTHLDKKSYGFTTIKNGEHNGIGYLTSNFDLKFEKKINLANLKAIIKKTALSEN